MAYWMSCSWSLQWIGSATGLYIVLNGLVLRTIREAGSQANPWITPAVALAYVAVGVMSRIFDVKRQANNTSSSD